MDFDDKNGGPAFPISIPGSGDNGYGGMTLRDWFAGQAINGMHSAMTTSTAWPDAPAMLNMARIASKQADAMLAARAMTD